MSTLRGPSSISSADCSSIRPPRCPEGMVLEGLNDKLSKTWNVKWQLVEETKCQCDSNKKKSLKDYWNEWRCIQTLKWLYRIDETMSRVQHTFILGCAGISQFLTVCSSTMCCVNHFLHWPFAVYICCSVFCPFNQLLPTGFGECLNIWVFVFWRLPEWDSCGSTRKLILLHTQCWVALNLINPLIVDKETQMQISDK